MFREIIPVEGEGSQKARHAGIQPLVRLFWTR